VFESHPHDCRIRTLVQKKLRPFLRLQAPNERPQLPVEQRPGSVTRIARIGRHPLPAPSRVGLRNRMDGSGQSRSRRRLWTEIAQRIQAEPWNLLGTDKTWVLNVLSQHRLFSNEGQNARRVATR
jgi:hypothetical protein